MTRDELAAWWQTMTANFIEKLSLIPDDTPQLDEPLWQGKFTSERGEVEEAMMPVRQLIAHCVVGSCDVPLALAGGGGFEPVKEAFAAIKDEPISRLKALAEERAATLQAYIAGLSEADLARPQTTPLGTRTVAEILQFTSLHFFHHKAQLMQAMRFLGIRPGRFI